MTTRTQDIITKFELEVNDATELSDVEELLIANRIYLRVCLSPYEFLKTPVTGTIQSDSTSSYITLPIDFGFLSPNYNYSEGNNSNDINLKPIVIFTGNIATPNVWKIINFSDRRQYLNKSGYAYLDLANNKIRFCYPPIDTNYDFDYVKVPAKLLTSTDPIWPERFDDIIVYGMAGENEVLVKSDKARSYKDDYNSMFESTKKDIKLWNARLINY